MSADAVYRAVIGVGHGGIVGGIGFGGDPVQFVVSKGDDLVFGIGLGFNFSITVVGKRPVTHVGIIKVGSLVQIVVV